MTLIIIFDLACRVKLLLHVYFMDFIWWKKIQTERKKKGKGIVKGFKRNIPSK